jgi:hypothetical protein
VVSPWAGARSVGTELYNHTSIIKTILTKFVPTDDLYDKSLFDGIQHGSNPAIRTTSANASQRLAT